MTFLAIDLGTSFIKGGVLDLDTARIEHIERVPFPDPLAGLPRLVCEINPADVVAAVRALIERLWPAAGNCEGLVMCSQLHGIVFVDRDGRAASTLTTWQDQRVIMPHPSGRGSYFDVMRDRLSPEQIHELGNELRPGIPIGLFFWLAEQGRLYRAPATAVSLPDFVLATLCGSAPSVELSNAMAYGLLNLKTSNWHSGVLAQLGLSDLGLPVIRRQGDVVGELKRGDKSMPCYTPVGDYQAALAGALLQYGELSLNISTGSQVSLLDRTLELGEYQTRPFFDGEYANTISHIPAGRALNLLVRLLGELAGAQAADLPDPWEYIAARVAEVTGTDLRVNLAFFASSCGDRGAIENIREENLNVGHLFRAAFENMADNYWTCAGRLSPERTWSRLVFSGGLAQKIDPLRRILCDRFGSDYRTCPAAEDTLLGLTALALAFSGRTASVRAAMTRLWATFY